MKNWAIYLVACALWFNGSPLAKAAEFSLPCDSEYQTADGCKAHVQSFLEMKGLGCNGQAHLTCDGRNIDNSIVSCDYTKQHHRDNYTCGPNAHSVPDCKTEMKASIPLNEENGDKIGSCFTDKSLSTQYSCKVSSQNCDLAS